MKLYFRLIWLYLTHTRRSSCTPIGPCETILRVLPNDLDLFGHVNNGVYLTLMDLARMDLMLRSGILKPIFKNGWYPIVASETIKFNRSLKLGQKFTIKTQIAGWDEKSIFLLQEFRRGETTVATAVVNARFLARANAGSPARSVTTPEVMSLINYRGAQPVLPDWITHWHQAMLAINEK